MSDPASNKPPEMEQQNQIEQDLPASSVFEKLQEYLEDFENGIITEVQLAEYLAELHERDSEHFLDKIDEYNEQLRKQLQAIEIAKRALEAANVVQSLGEALTDIPSVEAEALEALNKKLNQQLSDIKNPGDASEVHEQMQATMATMSEAQAALAQDGADTLQDHLDDMKDIAMGIKVDYLGSTRLSLGTGQILHGPLGEIMNMGFDKLQVEADNDSGSYISGFIVNAQQNLAGAIKQTAQAAHAPAHMRRPGQIG